MIIVVMGVMGAGKTTVGRALASRLAWRFLDADDFHSADNWTRLERGQPLSDAQRAPWLGVLRAELTNCDARGESVVLACSALRAAHRTALVPEGISPHGMRIVFLRAQRTVLATRLAARGSHRASPALLDSQLALLEEPSDAVAIDAALSPLDAVAAIVRAFGLSAPSPHG